MIVLGLSTFCPLSDVPQIRLGVCSTFFFQMGTVKNLESESLRKLIDNLQDAGCGKYVELPQIAVMGDTSCGKSSLLSALSGIEFPSSDKITTRCPTQIIMTNNSKEVNASFTASVRLRRYGKQDHSSENVQYFRDYKCNQRIDPKVGG